MQNTFDVDDATAAYILEARKHFEDLRQVAAQLAGLLVLAASGVRNAAPDHPMLESAGRLYKGALEGVQQVRPTVRARRHHRCLLNAASDIHSALEAARVHLLPSPAALEIDPILVPLRAGYAQLQQAANALPGFEMIAFAQGCCGAPK